MKKYTKILKKKWIWLYLFLWVIVLMLNVLAWNSTIFCDTYIAHVFPIWVNTYGRLMALFPFSVGEIMLVLAVILGGLSILLWFPAVIWRKIRSFTKKFYQFFAWLTVIVSLVMTLNCFILYHATTFSVTYFEESGKEEYSLEDLITVRNMVVEKCNDLADLMERDEEGNVLYDKDLGKQAVLSMKQLGKTYERLDGYYPRPKPLAASDFFSQQYMCGYFFPFSMEANYNQVMYLLNIPATMCHELSHLKGYILEDEANFISYLACIESDDLVFQYSGYLSVLNYLDNDFYKAVGKNPERYLEQPIISEQVKADNIFLTEDEWERINNKAVIDTETVDKISDIVVDTTLKVNGVQDGMISYNRVVELLLQYYEVTS